MALITWNTANANAYYDVATADAYFTERLNTANWDALNTADKESALIMTANILDRETYKGTKASGAVREWGRDNIVDKYGNAVANNVLPPDFNIANFEMALELANDNAVADTTNQGSNIKSLKAGSAEIEYFRSTSKQALPDVVYNYLKPYIESAGGDVARAYAYGTNTVTGIEEFSRTGGFA
jgi:hypothetical protein